MKKTKKLALNSVVIRALTSSELTRAAGGISGPMGCNYTDDNCGVTYNECDLSNNKKCQTGSCNSLACSQHCD